LTSIFGEICEKLQEKSYKVTPQRQIILKVLLENIQKHLSAEDVYEIVKKKHPEIGMATVYRTLDLLVELGILQKMNFGDGKTRFELNDENVHHHHHLICLSCGKVLEFELDLLDDLEERIAKKTDFDIVDHKLKFYGYCSDCRKNR